MMSSAIIINPSFVVLIYITMQRMFSPCGETENRLEQECVPVTITQLKPSLVLGLPSTHL